MNLSLRDIVKSFDGPAGTKVVDRASLSIRSGELFFLLGPSGCGKTTLLRILAGFLEPDSGEVLFGERRMNGVPPQDRNTALVFQNYAVWPHLTVFENVAYGLRLRKVGEPELTRRVGDALDQVGLIPFQARRPGTLSGGQQQRIALARAVVVRPDLLLLDEPLSNLDAQLRLQLLDEIGRIHRAGGLTSVYVTHDQEEALALADRIAVLDGGKVRQVGTPREIYDKPADAFVARFIGAINLLPATGPFARALGAREAAQVGFRPERVKVGPPEAGIRAKVTAAAYLGNRNELLLRTHGGEEVKAWSPEFFAPDSEVGLSVAPEHVHRFAE